jgi:site-specific recombinase XerD
MDARWQRCYSAFLTNIESISGSTRSRATYRYVLDLFFNDGRNPDAYNRSDVQNFLDAPSHLPYQHGQPVKPGTRNQRLMCLNSFYKYASTFEAGGMLLFEGRSPTFGLAYLKVGSSPKGLSASELSQFFSIIPTNSLKGLRDRAIFLMFFWTGRRRSEIARLTWADIEHVTIVDPDGSRRPGVVYQFIAKGKSRETQRTELPSPAWIAIERYLQAAGRLSTMQPDDALFTSTRPDQPNQGLTGDYLNNLFKQYCRKAGLSPQYSLHSLRHSAARLRYEAGSSIQDIQMYLGHSSLATTDVYLKRLSGVADTGAKLLERRFGNL